MKRPFPPETPGSLRDREAIVANDWNAFLALNTVESHWDRAPWPKGARRLYWYLTFEAEADLIRLARACQRGISDLEFDSVPDNGLHLTMLRLGPAEEFAASRLARVVAKAEGLCADIEPFDIEVGPLSGSAGAARLSVTPWNDLDRLHRALYEAASAEFQLVERPPFRPHVGIAYGNRRRPTREVIPSIAKQRGRASVLVPVNVVRLVELRREGQTYLWEPIASIQLNGLGHPGIPPSRSGGCGSNDGPDALQSQVRRHGAVAPEMDAQ